MFHHYFDQYTYNVDDVGEIKKEENVFVYNVNDK